MFRDRLADLFRETAGELGREAEILEKALSIVNRAKLSLEDLARLAGGVCGGAEGLRCLGCGS